MTFFGELPTPADHAEAGRRWVQAAIVGTVVPLVGLVLGLWVARRGLVKYFGVLLVLGLLIAVPVGTVAIAAHLPEPPPTVDPGPRVCQEHSGADNRCPGG